MQKRIKKIDKENNFYYLFAALVGMLFITSLESQINSSVGHYTFTAILILVFYVSLYSVHQGDSWKKVFAFMVVLIILLTISKKHLDSTISEMVNYIIYLGFFVHGFIATMKLLLRSDKVTSNMIVGSIAAYLQLGLIWSFIYLILLTINPHSFSGIEFIHWAHSFPEIAYFSFITLTTLGYGDILPATNMARFFTYTEVIVGVFYMAIIVSTIVSARMNEYQKENDT